MKSLVLFLFVLNLQVSASVFGQKVSLNMDNVSLNECLKAIEEQTSLGFLYNGRELSMINGVSVHVEGKEVSEVLSELLDPEGYTYSIRDGVILINKKTEAPQVTEEMQEKRTIKGVVKDAQTGEAIVGANVYIKNTTTGTITGTNGEFSLAIPGESQILVCSFIGYEVQEVVIGEQSEFHFDLAIETGGINEVVVTGYQTISRERAAGSFAKIDVEQLEARPSSINVLDRLEGTTAGLDYDANTGAITIRGQSTMNLSYTPLIVVDGFPVANPYGVNVNPEDVESIDVLKDASAASIWGARASNGVIVITTKKGKQNQKLKVDVSAFMSIANKIDYSDMDWMNTSDQIDMNLEYIEKGWNLNYSNPLTYHKSLNLLDQAQVYVDGLAPNGDVWTRAEYDKYVARLRTMDAEKHWEEHLLRNPIQNTYNIALSGGSERNTVYASFMYNNQKMASIGNASNEFIFNMNDTFKFNEWLQFNAGLTGISREVLTNGIDPSSMAYESPYNELVDEYGQRIQYSNAWNPWASQEREELTGISHTYNAIDYIQNNDNTTTSLNIRANFGVEATVMKNLKLASRFQYEKGYRNYDSFQSMNHYDQRIRVANMYVADPTSSSTDPTFIVPEGTRYSYNQYQNESWVFRNTATYDKSWNKHNLNLFGGMEVRKLTSNYVTDRKYGFDKQTLAYIPVNESAFEAGLFTNWMGSQFYDYGFDISNSDNREVSGFFNAGYDYDDRFVFNASVRVDQKNLFGSDPDFRYKPLWSTGFAWNMHRESFLTDADWLDRLRLRATLGVNGFATSYYSPYAQAQTFYRPFGTALLDMMILTKPANDNLKWEETKTTNIAVDFGMFENRFGGTIEFYNRKSDDLIASRTLDITNGFESADVNYASMLNRGMEVTLNADVIRNNGFNWRVSGTISYNYNKVTDIEDQLQTPNDIVDKGKLAIGKPLHNLYSFNYGGLDDAGIIQLVNPDGTTKPWIDRVGEEEELLYHGTTVAPWYGGLSNTFSYKGFDLTLNMVYKFGHVLNYNYGNGVYGRGYEGWFRNLRMNKVWLNRWQQPGDELHTRIPKIAYQGTNPFNGENEGRFDSYNGDYYWLNSQDNVIKADFIRVRDVILGYTVPKQYLSSLFLSDLRFTAQVKNPFLWVANDQGVDPEARYSMAYDNLLSFTFGLRANF